MTQAGGYGGEYNIRQRGGVSSIGVQNGLRHSYTTVYVSAAVACQLCKGKQVQAFLNRRKMERSDHLQAPATSTSRSDTRWSPQQSWFYTGSVIGLHISRCVITFNIITIYVALRGFVIHPDS